MVSKEFEQRVRFVGDTTILFRDKHSVVVQQGSTRLIFHRWYDRSRSDYARSWKPFCEALSRNRVMNMAECRRLALKYGVDMCVSHQPLGRLDGIKVIGARGAKNE